MSKEEIKKKAEKIADALGYNVNSLNIEVVNVKDSFCMGFVDGWNNAIDQCIEVAKKSYALEVSIDSDGYTYYNHPIPTEKYLTERLNELKK